MVEMKQFQKGDVIFKEGDSELCMYEVASGSVDIILHRGAPDEEKLTTVKANGVFGELGLIDYMARSATAIAAEDTSVTVIDDDSFSDYIKEKPELILHLIHSISDRIRVLSQDYDEACRDISTYYSGEKSDMGGSFGERIKKLISFGRQNA